MADMNTTAPKPVLPVALPTAQMLGEYTQYFIQETAARRYNSGNAVMRTIWGTHVTPETFAWLEMLEMLETLKALNVGLTPQGAGRTAKVHLGRTKSPRAAAGWQPAESVAAPGSGSAHAPRARRHSPRHKV